MYTCWPLERFRCLCQGHRNLTTSATYAAGLTDGRVRELRHCLACDSPVWVDSSPDANIPADTWESLEPRVSVFDPKRTNHD